MNRYIYRMRKLNASSNTYGDCECCGKFVDSVYIMTKLKIFNHRGAESLANVSCTFGHKTCLGNLTTH